MSAGQRKNPLFDMLGKLGQPAEAMKAWESWLTEQFDGLARNDRFLGQMGKAMEGSMLFRAQFNRLVEQSLHNMRMPSLGDIEALHGRLDESERMVERLSERLEAADAANLDLAEKLVAFSARNTALAERLEAALAGGEA